MSNMLSGSNERHVMMSHLQFSLSEQNWFYVKGRLWSFYYQYKHSTAAVHTQKDDLNQKQVTFPPCQIPFPQKFQRRCFVLQNAPHDFLSRSAQFEDFPEHMHHYSCVMFMFCKMYTHSFRAWKKVITVKAEACGTRNVNWYCEQM